jgi:hypothetical protein
MPLSSSKHCFRPLVVLVIHRCHRPQLGPSSGRAYSRTKGALDEGMLHS